jgi:hypothetical protein
LSNHMSSLLVLGVMGHPTWWDAKVAWWLVSKNAILKLLGFTVLPTALNCRSVMCSRVISCMEDYLPYCWDYSISTRTAQNKEKDCGKLWVYIFELSWSWALRHQATCGCESSTPFIVIYKAGHKPLLYWW